MSAVDVRSLPWSWYTDPAVLRLERERIFRRSWQYAGRTGQVAEPGAFFGLRRRRRPGRGRARPGRRAARVPQRLPPPRLARRARARASARRSSARTTPGRTASTARCARRRAPSAEPGFDKDELGLVPLRLDTWGPFVFVNPDRRRRRRSRRRSASCPERVAAPASTSTRCASCSAPSRESRPTGRSAARTSSSATTARSRTPGFSTVIDVSVDAYVLETKAGRSRRSTARCGRAWRATSTRAARSSAASSTSSCPNLTLNIMPGQPNLSIGPIVPTRAGDDDALPRLLRRPGRRAGVDRGDARVRRPGRRRGPRARRARPEGAARRR